MRIWLEYAAARIVIASLAVGPRSWSERLGRVYVRLLDLAIPRLRRVAEKNVRMALPELGEPEQQRIVDGSFHSIARILVALARFPQIGEDNVDQWIRYEGFEHFEASMREGHGLLFATAHLGNWELSAYAHAILSGQPMHVVVRALDNPKIDALVEGRRAMSGNRVIEKRDYARGILRALGKNEAVGVLVDQNAGLREGIFIDFFGIRACVATGFAKLAAHSRAPIIPGYALWSEDEQRYILKFYPPIHATGDAEEDTRRLHAHLESVIRQYPDQWLWMHRRWKTRPTGEPSIY
jgi:KDO2-lipid IV(A) lauroyltransferase